MTDTIVRVNEACEGPTANAAVAEAKRVLRTTDSLFSEVHKEVLTVNRVDIEEDEDEKWVCKFYREGVA